MTHADLRDDPPAADAADEAENLKIEDRIDEISSMQNSNPSKYASDRIQLELQGLYASRYPGEVTPAMGPGELDAGAPGSIAVAPGAEPGATGDEPGTTGDEPAPGLSGDDWAAFRESDADGAAQLEAEWHGDFEENVRIGQVATDELADEPLKALLNDTGLGDHPVVINFAAKMGRLRGTEGDPAVADELIERAANEELSGVSLMSLLEENDLMADPAIIAAAEKIGGFLTGDPGGVADTAGRLNADTPPTDRQRVQQRIDQLSSFQNTDPVRYASARVQEELRALYLSLHGHGDVSGPPRATLV